MKFSFLIQHCYVASEGQYPYPVIAVAGNVKDIVVLKLWVFINKIFLHRFPIEHIQPVSGRYPNIAFFINTHIIYAKIREAVGSIKMLKTYTRLGNRLKRTTAEDQ